MNPIAFEAALAMTSEKLSMALQKGDLSGLQKGDIVLTSFNPNEKKGREPTRPAGPLKQFFGGASRHLQGGYTHAGIYAGDGDLIEAEAQGIDAVVRRSLADSLSKREGAVAVRLKVPKKVRLKALAYAEKQIGKQYARRNSTLARQGLALISPKFTKLVDSADTPEERKRFTCGNLLTAAFEAQGHRVNDDERSWFLGTPVDFLNSDKGDLVKVIGTPDRHKALLGRAKNMRLVTDKLAEDIAPRRRLNVTNALTTAGVLGGAAWGLSRKGRFDASWLNPAWKNSQFGMKQRLAQGAMGAGTGAAVALPAQIATQPIMEKVQPTYDKSKAMVQGRALPGWGR